MTTKTSKSSKAKNKKPVAGHLEDTKPKIDLPVLKKGHVSLYANQLKDVSLTDVAMIASSLLPKAANAHDAIYQAYHLLEIAASAHSAIERTANYGEGIHQHQKAEIQRIEFETSHEELARGLPKDLTKDEKGDSIRDEDGTIKPVPWDKALSNLFGNDTPANREKKFLAFVAARTGEAKAAKLCKAWKSKGIPPQSYQDCRICCDHVKTAHTSKGRSKSGEAGGEESGRVRRGESPKATEKLNPTNRKAIKAATIKLKRYSGFDELVSSGQAAKRKTDYSE